MINGFIQIPNNFHRQHRCQVFLAPVGFGGLAHAVHNAAGQLAAAQFHAGILIAGGQLRQHLLGNGIGYQQGLGGIAGAVALSLGVVGHLNGFGDIGLIINIGVAIAIQVLDDRYPGLVADPLDQALAAAGNNHIHIFRVSNQLANGRPIGGLHHLDGGIRQAGLTQTDAQALGNGLIGIDGL